MSSKRIPNPTFGEQQLRLMRQLWRKPLSARALTEALNAEADESPMAHSTVQTFLRQLEGKQAVTHDKQDRTFIFRPLVEEGRTLAQATREFVARLFKGSVQGLVAHLIESDQILPGELARVEALIVAARKKGK